MKPTDVADIEALREEARKRLPLLLQMVRVRAESHKPSANLRDLGTLATPKGSALEELKE